MALLAVAPALPAFAGGLANVCTSAPAPNGEAAVNVDIWAVADTSVSARFFHSSDGQSTWTEQPMSLLGTPGYENTWQGIFAVPPSGRVWYYLQADTSRFRTTESPFNSADSWPPPDNLLAWAAVEPSGDAFNNPEGPWLDLTGVWLGYSGEYFYFRLTNNHDSWPTSGGFLKWYFYSVGFTNPAAPSDTWVFAPVYVDAWPVMQFGLYAINRYTDDTPERIGDIDYHTTGNRLDMRCRISDMTGDPRFGPWPSSLGWLACAANAQAVTPGGATLKDTTATTTYYALRTHSKTVGWNSSPQVNLSGVEPDTGTGQTEFLFGVRYADSDTNLPLVRRLRVDDDSFELAPNHHRYWNGVVFQRRVSGFSPGRHYFSFRFDDGMASVTTPDDSFFVFGAGVNDCGGSSSTTYGPSLTRGVLLLPQDMTETAGTSGRVPRPSLLDAAGRKILGLTPGANDVRSLAPGVYFVVGPRTDDEGRSAAEHGRPVSPIRKVIIAR
jgi:hypothetical protein